MQTTDNAVEENRHLRRTMRDLVALSTLPAAWTGLSPDGIARSLADVLLNTLSLDLIYVRLDGLTGGGVVEALRTRHGPDAALIEAVKASLAPLLGADRSDPPSTIPNPLGAGRLNIAVTRFGIADDQGVMIAGSRRADFPSEGDRLLLGVGANQTATVIQRRIAEDQVREQQERLRTTLACIGDGVITTDTAGRITTMNAVAESLTGWTQEEATGQPLDTVFRIVNEETRQTVHNPATRAMQEGIVVGLANHTVLLAKDGMERSIDDSAAPIWCKEGQIVGCVLVFRDVTERRRLEKQKVKQAEAARRLAAIVDSSEDAIISKTLDSIIQTWNAAAERVFGYTAEEAVGRSITMLFPADRLDEEDKIIARIRAGERVEHFDTVRRRKDGSTIPVSLTISPIRDEEGRIVGASKIARDISERRQAEAALRRSEERLTAELEATTRLHALSTRLLAADNLATALQDVVENALVTVGADFGNIQLYNAQIEALEIVAQRGFRQDFLDYFRTVRLDEGSACAQAMQSGERIIIEDVELDPAFTPHRPVAAAAGYRAVASTPIKSRKGTILGMLSTHFRNPHRLSERDGRLLDLFARHAADLIERLRSEEALRQSEERFRQLAENVTEVFWMTDPQTTQLLYISPAYERVWGRSCQSLYENVRSFMDAIHPDDRERVRKAVLEKQSRGEQTDKEYRVVRPDGSIRWVRDRAFPVFNAAGEFYRLVGIIDDFTERKQAEEALKEADRRKDEFLATLAHELRNPLAPIRNAVQIFRAKGSPVPELQWARDVIDRQVEQMTRLVDDLLDVSRITRGKIELRKERVQLAVVVSSAVEASRPLIEKWGHDFTVQLPPEPVYLEADQTRLAQVLLNLLNNAAKYSEQGGRIWLTAEREGRHIVIRVKDTGIGIPEEMLPRIFEMFTQVDQSLERSQGGLGIGLTLVRSLVEMHGGTVEAHSDGPGKGSEFVVRLPAAKEVEDQAARRTSGGDGVAAPAKCRILVVDDNQDAADSLAMLLRIMGNEVHTAHDGLEAVGAAGVFRPDVVLLDIGLPKLNGYEAGRLIREQQGNGIVLIALTGWGQEEDRRRSKEAGFDYHMTKPVEFDTLQQVLAGLNQVSA